MSLPAGRAPVGAAFPARAAAPLADARLTGRLTMAFLLDVVCVARRERHLLDTLLLSTISQANVAPISRQADLQVTYATLDNPPPDELRRPVSMNALATSLGLPFETVRRRVRRLIAEGICRPVGNGVIVPTEVLTSPIYVRDSVIAYQLLVDFYARLRDLRLITHLPAPSVELGDDVMPLRTVARIAADCVLRVIDTLMRAVGDLREGVILAEILRSNTEHLPPDLRGGQGNAPGDFIPDTLRRPVRISAVAGRVGLPIETVRRHAKTLLARGLCVRTPAGLVVPAEVLARPEFIAFNVETLANLQRMFASLSQLGVLAVWDRARPPA